jgi:prophage antirepressor-like protein
MTIAHTSKNGQAASAAAGATTSKSHDNRDLLASLSTNFNFDGAVIRMIWIVGVPWFLAADVCRALELRAASNGSYTRHLQKLDADEKQQVSRDLFTTTDPLKGAVADNVSTSDVGPIVWVISESGLYTMILRSDGAVRKGTVAHRFRAFVTREVLPAIRKTGTYHAHQLPPDPHAAKLAEPGREALAFDPSRPARYVVTVFPNEATHIRETPLDAMLDEWSAFDTDILASHIRTVHALWQKTQLMRSIGGDPAGSPLYDRLGATILEGRRLADEYLRHVAIRPD